jgi:hypothetical protein
VVIVFPIRMVPKILIMQETDDGAIVEHRKVVIAESEKELLHFLDRLVFRDAQHMLSRDHDVAHGAFEQMAKGDAMVLPVGDHAENDAADHEPKRAPVEK